MNCPRCSTDVPREARFCPSCGAPLDPEGTVPSGGAETVSSADAGTVPSGAGKTVRSPGPEPDAPRAGSPPLGASGADSTGRFLPGTTLAGRYRIFGLLGRGGMGEVYRADDLKLGQPVALKFLPSGLERDPDRLERLLAEVRTARQVTHPNVCRVYDIVEADGHHFLSMEYVDGEDLGSLLRRIGRLPGDKAVQIARQLCAGVQAAHEQGILHRDLKPANVMIDGRGRVRITDFGLAGLESSIAAGDRSGTPAYMAPEQLAGGEVTVRSDLYALGLVLNELFTGRHAFEGAMDPARRDPDATPTPPSTRVEGLDPAVERVILRCLERDPARRPASALSVAAGLPGGDPIAAALAAGETPSPEVVAEAGRREAMRPGAAILLAVAGLVLFVAAARWAGTMSILHYLPLEKKPAVLVDRAQGILEQLGYEEPVYREPVDQESGLLLWTGVIHQVRDADDSARRWDALRDRPDAITFWYRQSPKLLAPVPFEHGPVLLRGPGAYYSPTPSEAGEALISLDLAGRLRRLEVLPKRLSTRNVGEPDWSPLFELAGLDPERFTEERPRYQRFLVPDHRRAWVGTRAELPDVELHVEAGSFEGRPCLFDVSSAATIEFLGDDPEPERPTLSAALLGMSEPLLILALVLAAAWLARRNVRQGRADRRGATRLALVMGIGVAVGEGFRSHVMGTAGWPREIWPLFVAAVMVGGIVWTLYAAAEPVGRRVWPTVFVSSSRLLSRPRIMWGDPLLGRSALTGLIAGALLFALLPLARIVETWIRGAPPGPLAYDLDILAREHGALQGVLAGMTGGAEALILVMLVVALRLLLRKSWAAGAVAVVVWPLMWVTGTTGIYVLSAIGVVGRLIVLLRGGVLALLVASIVSELAGIAAVPDLSAWYAQAAVMATLAAVALAVYGVRAAAWGGARAAAPAQDPADEARLP